MSGIMVSMKLEGAEQLLKALEEADKQAKKALKEAGKAGGEVFRKAAKDNAPGPAIVTVIEKSSEGKVEVAVGPDKKHWYYRFFETGARPHEIRASKGDVLYLPGVGREFFGSASETGGVNAKPFLRPAFDTKREAALKAFGDMIWKALGRTK
jgi:HK97 gp10 family phage protein